MWQSLLRPALRLCGKQPHFMNVASSEEGAKTEDIKRRISRERKPAFPQAVAFGSPSHRGCPTNPRLTESQRGRTSDELLPSKLFCRNCDSFQDSHAFGPFHYFFPTWVKKSSSSSTGALGTNYNAYVDAGGQGSSAGGEHCTWNCSQTQFRDRV